MKKIFMAVVVLAVVATACKGEKKEAVETKEAKKVEVSVSNLNNVDTAASVLNWKGNKPTGSHNGVVSFKSAGLVVENGKITQGEFIIDMNTIVNKDMAGSDGAGKLEGHLKSSDFFDVAQYPTSKFVITSVVEEEGILAITGNLTIKDVTKSITIPGNMSTEGGVTTFTSDPFVVNRADFNISYKSKSFFDNLKDKFIDDLMEMSFVVKTKA